MNYEALGRYTEAKEKIKQLTIERMHVVLRIEGLVRDARDISSESAAHIVDMSVLHEAVRLLDEKNDELGRVIARHNQAAGETGRPLLRIR